MLASSLVLVPYQMKKCVTYLKPFQGTCTSFRQRPPIPGHQWLCWRPDKAADVSKFKHRWRPIAISQHSLIPSGARFTCCTATAALEPGADPRRHATLSQSFSGNSNSGPWSYPRGIAAISISNGGLAAVIHAIAPGHSYWQLYTRV